MDYNANWVRTCNSEPYMVVEVLRFLNDYELVLTFFPSYPDGHKHKAEWAIKETNTPELNSTKAHTIAARGILGEPNIQQARCQAIGQAKQHLYQQRDLCNQLLRALDG